MFGGSASGYNRALFRCLNCAQRVDHRAFGNSRRLGLGIAAKHLIDGIEKRICRLSLALNKSFPSSLVPLFQSESKCETILMKTTLICMKMKLHAELIFIRKVSHLGSF